MTPTRIAELLDLSVFAHDHGPDEDELPEPDELGWEEPAEAFDPHDL